MIGPFDYAAFVKAGPHCSACGEIPPACICSACEYCDEHALEPELVEAADGSLVHAKCLDNANEAAREAMNSRSYATAYNPRLYGLAYEPTPRRPS